MTALVEGLRRMRRQGRTVAVALWALACVERDTRPDQRGHPKQGRLSAEAVGDQCSHPVVPVQC